MKIEEAQMMIEEKIDEIGRKVRNKIKTLLLLELPGVAGELFERIGEAPCSSKDTEYMWRLNLEAAKLMELIINHPAMDKEK